MANQLIFALPRVTDSNGDPASGALAYFYQTGTTSPVTVYTDTGLSVAHANPVVADSGGAFAQVFYGGATDVKVAVKTSAGVTLYQYDPCPMITGVSSDAEGISFSPITGNAATNVQDAIEINTLAIAGAIPETRSISAGTGLTGGGDLSANRTISLDLLDEDDMATDSATKAASQQSIKAYVDARGLSSASGEYFESSPVNLVSDGDFAVAHSLGATPRLVVAVLVCGTSDAGYAVGDELVLAGNSGTNTGVTWAANGTNIVGSFGSQIPVNAIGATSANLTFGSWTMRLRAWK